MNFHWTIEIFFESNTKKKTSFKKCFKVMGVNYVYTTVLISLL